MNVLNLLKLNTDDFLCHLHGSQNITHPADHASLAGVTRANVVSQARSMGLEIGERPFGLDEVSVLIAAFLTGTTIAVLPVTRIDGRPVADGTPGPVTLALRSRVLELRNR